ncbi:MAG: hypothetical protein U5K79_00835 [Cyclobacteriaceae bacterium]|nr:hypothetical protein [Cyclobacteriaceae bacterium]
MEKELYVMGAGLIGICANPVTWLELFRRKPVTINNGLVEVIEDLFHMPKTMGQLAVVQFFTWFALFSMWIYTNSACYITDLTRLT